MLTDYKYIWVALLILAYIHISDMCISVFLYINAMEMSWQGWSEREEVWHETTEYDVGEKPNGLLGDISTQLTLDTLAEEAEPLEPAPILP